MPGGGESIPNAEVSQRYMGSGWGVLAGENKREGIPGRKSRLQLGSSGL